MLLVSQAELELAGAALWWSENRDPDQAFRWLEGFEAAISALADNPGKCPLAREDAEFDFELRQLNYGLSPKPTHRALFRVDEAERLVRVLSIRHLHQKDITPEDL